MGFIRTVSEPQRCPSVQQSGLCGWSAGYGGLALAIEGPSKVDIQTKDLEDGTCEVTYCPTEPGSYIVSIRFAEEHIPGRSRLLF